MPSLHIIECHLQKINFLSFSFLPFCKLVLLKNKMAFVWCVVLTAMNMRITIPYSGMCPLFSWWCIGAHVFGIQTLWITLLWTLLYTPIFVTKPCAIWSSPSSTKFFLTPSPFKMFVTSKMVVIFKKAFVFRVKLSTEQINEVN